MAGGKARRRTDRGHKVAAGETVKTGTILIRGLSIYKAGLNARGVGTIYSLRDGKVSFSRKKTPHGKVRTFVNVL